MRTAGSEAKSRNEPGPRALWYLDTAKLHTALAVFASAGLRNQVTDST
jgi:hypothetical protein